MAQAVWKDDRLVELRVEVESGWELLKLHAHLHDL
jgi:hypothetical protein